MWVRRRLDIDWSDILAGLRGCAGRVDPDQIADRIESRWSEQGKALACLSVRTGFDLLLGALALPYGSEVLVSAITIPDIVRIIRHHGLTPVPLDLDNRQLAPSTETLDRAITPATRAVVLAHMFGSRTKLDGLARVARSHGLYHIEDCAQAFDGGYTGHPLADAAMFSFGSIKTATALGGALLRINNPDILAKVRERHSGFPRQTRSAYLMRLLKYAALKAATSPALYGALVHLLRTLRVDHDRLANHLVRGFPGPQFFDLIRRRPSGPLLSLLERRLRTCNTARLTARAAHGRILVRLIGGAVDCTGGELPDHTYWVFPILVDGPQRVIRGLLKAGFDATQGQSLSVVPAPADRPELRAVSAEDMLRRMVFVPVDAQMPEAEINRLARVLLELVTSSTEPPEVGDCFCDRPIPPPVRRA
jgi:dTDP-4-amino-4,6-dideoxygalactose transaminase